LNYSDLNLFFKRKNSSKENTNDVVLMSCEKTKNVRLKIMIL